jgi:transglutaminase-like putative cysteine protease
LSRLCHVDDRGCALSRDGRTLRLRIYDIPDDSGDGHAGAGNTHAWAQVYLPGPGWVDLDPSSGIIGNRDLVRVAVVYDPRQAVPLHGTWMGFPSDYLGMDVEVVVTSDAAKSEGANADFAARMKSGT